MTEDIIKTKKVTFSTGLPRATVATFTHDGETWFAYPQKKAAAVLLVTDRLLGIIDRIREDATQWVNTHPEDAARAMRIMARTNQATELAREKVQAWTM